MTAEKELTRSCPICLSPWGTILHVQRFVLSDDHPLQNSYDLVACRECGFCFADTGVSQSSYDSYYAMLSKYADSGTSTGAGIESWDAERLNQIADEVVLYSPNRASRILDMGCANGGLISALLAQGYVNVGGIDPALTCIERIRASGRNEAWVGTLSNLPQGIGKFDGIVLSHVMEHVKDLSLALERVRQLLNPDGWVYIEVPDATRYDKYLVSPFQDFNTEHINHFSKASLANLLAVNSFTPEVSGAKQIYSAKNFPYPAVFWFARVALQKSSIEKDVNLRPALEHYIHLSQSLMARFDGQIRNFLNNHHRIIVWGTGQLTMKLLTDTCLNEANIVGFVDGNPINQGSVLRGVKVTGSGGVKDGSIPILVCSVINSAAISEAIRSSGLTNPILTFAS